jgi:anti-sigma factor RsiW
MHKYTPEDLLRYLYKEMSTDEVVAMEEELPRNWALREKLAVLKASQERLNRIVESPRTEVVLNILRYAAATEKIVS